MAWPLPWQLLAAHIIAAAPLPSGALPGACQEFAAD
jgi:hypothetical protein